MTIDDVRRLALALPETAEASHFDRPDFRVHGKIFATLWTKEGRAVVLLTPDQQSVLIAAEPKLFAPVPGGWGRRGATFVTLAAADETTLRSALRMAWGNKAPKRLSATSR